MVAGAAGRVFAFSAKTVVGVLEVLGVSLRRFTIMTTTTMLMTTAAATAARYGDFLRTGEGGSGPSSTRRSRGRTLRSEGSDSVGSRGPPAPTLGGGTAIISSSASETISREAGGDPVSSMGTLDVSSRPARNGASSSPPMIAAPVAIACFGCASRKTGRSVNSWINCATSGIREDPPTNKMRVIWSNCRPAD